MRKHLLDRVVRLQFMLLCELFAAFGPGGSYRVDFSTGIREILQMNFAREAGTRDTYAQWLRHWRARPRTSITGGGGGGAGNAGGFLGRRSRNAESSASRAFSYFGVPGLAPIDWSSAAGNSCASGLYFWT